ncbi:MAG TPA: paraquat-inducible protein A [Caldimonas sp.]|nr:paraquat-inducible protein A [Caldimonas sp.]HEX2542567.1 paraquat-inducible protein A [Caldimonas sp.]
MSRIEDSLVLCADCGKVHRWQRLEANQVARCARCDAILGRGHRLGTSAVLALTTAAAATFIVAVSTPLLSLNFRGGSEAATVLETVAGAWRAGYPFIAIVAAVTALLAPAMLILLRLYVLAPLSLGRKPPGFAWCVRLLHQAGRWSMVGVFTIGALLSLVRLAAMADASPGPGLYALGAVTVLLAAIESAGLKHLWWDVR